MLNDGLNSITRYYLNNFKDGFRQVRRCPPAYHPRTLSKVDPLRFQDAYDLFLGNYVVGHHRSPFAMNYRPVATTLVPSIII